MNLTSFQLVSEITHFNEFFLQKLIFNFFYFAVTYLAQFYHLFKNEDKNVSPNVSLHLSSESESETPLGTPTSNKKTFDKNDLIEKYGEEIFCSKTKTPAIKKVSTEEEDEGVVVTMTRPKRRVVGGVASMCKDFERRANIQ